MRVVPAPGVERVDDVRDALATVVDPELDEPVTELGFVTALDVDTSGGVAIEFRLPTYWCAANFAYLMADDMRRAVLALPWVREVRLRLVDHMYEEPINRGVADGVGFRQAFGDAASADLDELRHTFLVKAFQRRQEALIQHLIDGGRPAAQWIGLDVGSLERLPLDAQGMRLRDRYLERRFVIGTSCQVDAPRDAHQGARQGMPGDAPSGSEPAFVDVDGRRLAIDGLADYLRVLRGVCVNAEFNGVLCRGLLAVRDRADRQATDVPESERPLPVEPVAQAIRWVRAAGHRPAAGT